LQVRFGPEGRLAAMSGQNNFKVVLLGEGRVGKTSTVLRYVQNKFDDRTSATIQASFLNKRISVAGQNTNLVIWDTAGQERFHALGPIYYRDADGALLLFDVTDAESFEKVKMWVKELRKMVGKDICIAIAGNKCDLERNRKVSTEEGTSYAKSVDAAYFNVSAKLNRGIDDTFLDLAKRMLDGRKKAAPALGGGGFPRSNQPKITISNEEAPKKGGCC